MEQDIIYANIGLSPTEAVKGLRGSLKLYSRFGNTTLLEFSEDFLADLQRRWNSNTA